MNMSDKAVEEKSLEKYKEGMKKRLISHFSQFLDTLTKEQLEEMVNKL